MPFVPPFPRWQDSLLCFGPLGDSSFNCCDSIEEHGPNYYAAVQEVSRIAVLKLVL